MTEKFEHRLPRNGSRVRIETKRFDRRRQIGAVKNLRIGVPAEPRLAPGHQIVNKGANRLQRHSAASPQQDRCITNNALAATGDAEQSLVPVAPPHARDELFNRLWLIAGRGLLRD